MSLWQESVTSGKRHIEVTERRTGVDFAHVLKDLVDVHYPEAEVIVLRSSCYRVSDGQPEHAYACNTHTPASLYEAFAPVEAKRLADTFEIHYTPRHGSWLNMAEIELSVLSRQCLSERMSDKTRLVEQIAAWEFQRNARSMRVNWRFTTADARIKLKRLYPTILP